MRLQMQENLTKSFEWAQKYSTQETCLEELNWHRWKNGFTCLKCGHDNSWRPKHSYLPECAKCGVQVSPTASTVIKHTLLPSCKLLAVTYLMGTDKGGSSVQQLFKMVGASWPTAYQVLRNLRQSMGERDCGYWLRGCQGGLCFHQRTQAGQEKSPSKGKKAVFFTVGRRKNGMSLRAAKLVGQVNSEQIREFEKRIAPNSEVRTDILNTLRVLGESCRYEPKSTSLERVVEWFSNTHTVISNFKSFLSETFHGHLINISRNILRSLCCATIADSGNLSC